MITVTEAAADIQKVIRDPNDGKLFTGVKGGGCAGFSMIGN